MQYGGMGKMQMHEFSPYERILDTVRQLSPSEQLALVSDIVTGLRESVPDADELAEASLLAKSPTFQRLIENGLAQIAAGKARPIEALFSEL